jgi:hypothetical protein
MRLEGLVLIGVPRISWRPRTLWRTRRRCASLDVYTPEEALDNLRRISMMRARLRANWTSSLTHGVYEDGESIEHLEWVKRIFGKEGGW